MRCVGTKPNGERCSLPATTGKDVCFGHDPAAAQKRKKRSKRAGKAAAKYARRRACDALTGGIKAKRKKEFEERMSQIDENAFVDWVLSRYGGS